MTDSNMFFRIVWRLNGLVFLCLGLLLLVLAAVTWGGSLFQNSAGRDLPAVAVAEQPADQKLKPQLDNFRRAEGAVFHASLFGWSQDGEESEGKSKYSSVYGYRTRPPVLNVVFFNATDGSTKRLFPDDGGLVVAQQEIARVDENGKQQVVGRAFTYVGKDTNGDRRLSETDRQDIVVTKPDGSNPVTIVEGVDNFDTSYRMAATSPILSWFSKIGDELTYGEFDTATFQPGRTLPVTVLQK